MYKPPPRSPRARSFRARRSFVIRRSLAAGRVRHRGGVRRGGHGLAVHGLRRVLGRRRVLGLLPVLRLHRHRRGGLHGVLGLRAALDGVELLFSVARAAAHEGEDEQRDQARDGAAVRLVHEVAGLAVDLEKEEKEEGGGGDVSDDAAGFRAKSRAAGSREKHARRPRGDGVGRAGTAGHAPRRTAPRAAWRPPHVVAPAASRQVRRASGVERRLSRVDVSATIQHPDADQFSARGGCVEMQCRAGTCQHWYRRAFFCLFFYFSRRSESSPRRARVHLLSAYEYISRPP